MIIKFLLFFEHWQQVASAAHGLSWEHYLIVEGLFLHLGREINEISHRASFLKWASHTIDNAGTVTAKNLNAHIY